MTTGPTLLATLRELEQRLHQPELRADAEQLGALLHPSFSEADVDGRTWSREETLAEFRDAPPSYAVWAQDFTAEAVIEGVVLLRYRSAHIDEAGRLSRFVMRTSLWQRTDAGWQLRFHQGTPTDAFEKQAN